WGDGSSSVTERAAGETDEAFASGAPAAASAPASAKAAPRGASAPTTLVPGGIVAPPQRSGPGLRAGSVDDNAAFADYLKYRDEFRHLGIKVHDVDVSIRHVVTVVDEAGQPLLGA